MKRMTLSKLCSSSGFSRTTIQCFFSRFEEIKDDDEEMKDESPAAPASKKRPRESDAVESTTDGEAKLSKKQQKKLNKKLKTDDGKAVSNGDVKPEESGKKSAKKEDQVKEEKKSEKKEKKKDKKEGEKEESKKAGELKETSSGLKIKDHKTGSGKTAKKGDKVSMRYIGRFMDGKVFDSNTQKGKKPVRQCLCTLIDFPLTFSVAV